MENNNWLILGGVGYIGRNLSKFLLDNHLCGHLSVADKSLPSTSYFHPSLEQAFQNLEYIQVDLARNPSKAFNKEYRYIINCTGETRSGLPDSRYRQNSIGVVQACKPFISGAKWIEISSALVYKSNKKGALEADPTDPWTVEGRLRLECEQALIGTNHVVLRSAKVYGFGDFHTVTPRAILAAVYLRLKKKMKMLWGEDLKIATVHISDLCRAVIHVKDFEGVYNVTDDAGTTQGDVGRVVQELFGIRTEYYSRIISNMASLTVVAEEANEIHMTPWGEICAEGGVECPIYPYVEQENLDGSHLAVNNQKIRSTGFEFFQPRVTAENVRESLNFLIEAGVLPRILN